VTPVAPAAPTPRGRLALGTLLVALGVAWTLANLGVLEAAVLTRGWPLVVVAVGAFKALQAPAGGQRALGVGLLVLGIFFQVQMLLTWNFRRVWPLLLVLFGGLLLWRAFDRRMEARAESDSPGLAELAFIGGAKRVMRTSSFGGGYVTVVMGGIEVDLRQSSMASSPSYLDVFALWGGIEIRVPPEWRVDAKGVPLIGGFEDKTQTPLDASAAPRLVVRGQAVMGGVEISN
jgi:cell wall-active antibiotic response 4TMS protein YvqF